MNDYIQAFPKETRDMIAIEFCAYFDRKKKSRLTYSDAKKLIDFVSGPAPGPRDAYAQDYSLTRVSGGGPRRPSNEDVENMMGKYIDGAPNKWDAVFGEIMYRVRKDRDIESLILMTFRDRLSDPSICDDLGISRTTYFVKRRGVLDQAGVIAVKFEVLDPWKY